MTCSLHKKTVFIITVTVFFSFFTSLSFAAPAVPVLRTPGTAPVTGQKTTAPKPAGTDSSRTSEPSPGLLPSGTVADNAPENKPAVTDKISAPAVIKHNSDTHTGTVQVPGSGKSNTKITAGKDYKSSAEPQNTTVPGHPFRVQNKEENYKSLLSKSATRKLDAALSGMIGGTGDKVPGLAVIVYKDGKEVYRNMMGNRFLSPRNKNWNLPVTADSRFRVASISKIFTAAGYLKLAEQGKINLDEDVSRYLGFTLRNPKFPGKAITSRMLLSHTSSVRDYPSAYIPFKSSVRAFFESGKSWSSSKAPGTYFSYSNLNYILLATILEKVSGQRFDKYITKNILKPLDIRGSFNLRDFSSGDLQKMGTIYRKTKGESARYYAQIDDRPIDLPSASLLANYRPGTNAGIFSPQGGLRISPDELAHMLQMLMNQGTYKGKRILAPDTVRLMETQIWKYNPADPNGDIDMDAIESYGMPLQYFSGSGSTRPVPDRKDFHLIGHLGEAFGFIGGLLWQPDTKNGFIFLQNGCASSGKYNKGRYSRNYRWEENFMKSIIENVFP